MDSVDWARAHFGFSKLIDLGRHGVFTSGHQPWYSALAYVTQSYIGCGGIMEIVSNETPSYLSNSPEEDGLLPIDVVFGTYNPETREIRIFQKNISSHAERLRWDPSLLMGVVRLHEWAHAFVHLALPQALESRVMKPEDSDRETQWATFVSAKTSWFMHVDSAAHEYLAQAITYSVLNRLIDVSPEDRAKWVELFEAVEVKQPLNYHLSDEDKSDLVSTRWESVLAPLILHAIGDGLKAENPPNLNLPESWRIACRELVSINSDKAWTVTGDAGEVLVQDPYLQRGVPVVFSQADQHLEFLVGRLGSLKFSVYSREHPPPHFNVKHGNESANFRLDTGERINGGLARYRCDIQSFYKSNRSQLIQIWNDRRPADCPVGPVRD